MTYSYFTSYGTIAYMGNRGWSKRVPQMVPPLKKLINSASKNVKEDLGEYQNVGSNKLS